MFPIEAETPEKLRDILIRTRIDVPLRELKPENQHQEQPKKEDKLERKEQSEKWQMQHFLLAVSQSELLEFPVRIEHQGRFEQDGPDFVLPQRSGRIGIDLTEAVHPDWAEIDAIRNGYEIEALQRPGRYLPGVRQPPKRSKQRKEEIQRIACGCNNPLPRMGDQVERDWAEVMAWVIQKKAERLESRRLRGRPDYTRNWLLIYDNWPGLGNARYQDSRSGLWDWLSCPERNIPFERIFILHGAGSVITEYPFPVCVDRGPSKDAGHAAPPFLTHESVAASCEAPS